MAMMNALATYEYEELIVRLVEMAGALRDARRAGAAIPVLCLLDCDPRQWVRWGHAERCANCGTPPLAADVWHAALTRLLRVCVPRGGRRAA